MTPKRGAETKSKMRRISHETKNLLDLPNEVLLHILTFLSVKSICCIKLTCLKFCKLAHCSEIMKKQFFVLKNFENMKILLKVFVKMNASSLNLRFEYVGFTNYYVREFTNFLQSHASKINSITFRSCCEIPQKMVEDIMILCDSLKELSFNKVEITESRQLRRIIPEKTNTTLKILVYRPYEYWSNEFIDSFVISLLNFYPAIESFSWDRPFKGQKQKIFRSVMDKIATCDSMQELHLHDLRLDEYWNEFLHSDLKWQRLLKFTFNCYRLTSKNLKDLLSRCSQLESLSLIEIEHCSASFCELMRVISKYKGDLKHLLCDKFDMKLVEETWREDDIIFSKLETFKFRWHLNTPASDEFPFRFLRHSRNLKRLNLHCFIPVHNIEGMLGVILPLQNNLITLEIELDYNYKDNDELLASLDNLNVTFPKLELLRIGYDGDNINEKSVFVGKILEDCDFPKLKKLELGYIHSIKKKEIEKIIDTCPDIEFLEFYCNKVEKNDIVESCNALKNLRSVRILLEDRNADSEEERPMQHFEPSWQYPSVIDEKFLRLEIVLDPWKLL